MKKLRFLAWLMAILLLLSVAACKKDEANGNGTPDSSGEDAATNAPDTGSVTDADDYRMAMGFPLGFSLRVTGQSGYGFDTASGTVFCGSEQKTYNFAPHLSALYAEMTEHDIYALCATGDLTYKAIAGSDTADLNESYTLTFTDNGTTYTVKTDKAALNAYADRSDIANLASLIQSLSGFAQSKFG